MLRGAILALALGAIVHVVYVVWSFVASLPSPVDPVQCDAECRYEPEYGIVIDGVCYCGWRRI